MPYIDSRFSFKMSESEKEELKSEFGKMIALMDKPESYLMVSIADDSDLWFGGNKLEKGAYIAVSIYSQFTIDPGENLKRTQSFEKFTAASCKYLEDRFGIPQSSVYITYTVVPYWGWNGSNF